MNKLRNIALAATAALLVTGAWALLLQFQQNDVRFAHIRLPVAFKVPVRGIGHRTVVVELDHGGILSIHRAELSHQEFSEIIRSRHERLGEFLVCIAADRESGFDNVWSIIATCRSHGLQQYCFVVARDSNQQDISQLFFHTPHDDLEPPDSNVTVLLAEDTITVNGRKVSYGDSALHFSRVGSYDPSTPISIEVSPIASYSNIISVLASCAHAGLDNVGIRRAGPAQQDESGAAARSGPSASSHIE